MKPNHIPYNDPALCVHYGLKNRCTAGWFHGKCALCYNCIRCPKYEPKTGLTYDIINDDEIADTLLDMANYCIMLKIELENSLTNPQNN